MLRFVSLGFPVAVMGVNVLGSFIMQMFVVFTIQRGITQLSPFEMTGLLGGFAKFWLSYWRSSICLSGGVMGQALAYVTMSVVLSIGGLILGLMIARGIWV